MSGQGMTPASLAAALAAAQAATQAPAPSNTTPFSAADVAAALAAVASPPSGTGGGAAAAGGGLNQAGLQAALQAAMGMPPASPMMVDPSTYGMGAGGGGGAARASGGSAGGSAGGGSVRQRPPPKTFEPAAAAAMKTIFEGITVGESSLDTDELERAVKRCCTQAGEGAPSLAYLASCHERAVADGVEPEAAPVAREIAATLGRATILKGKEMGSPAERIDALIALPAGFQEALFAEGALEPLLKNCTRDAGRAKLDDPSVETCLETFRKLVTGSVPACGALIQTIEREAAHARRNNAPYFEQSTVCAVLSVSPMPLSRAQENSPSFAAIGQFSPSPGANPASVASQQAMSGVWAKQQAALTKLIKSKGEYTSCPHRNSSSRNGMFLRDCVCDYSGGCRCREGGDALLVLCALRSADELARCAGSAQERGAATAARRREPRHDAQQHCGSARVVHTVLQRRPEFGEGDEGICPAQPSLDGPRRAAACPL